MRVNEVSLSMPQDIGQWLLLFRPKYELIYMLSNRMMPWTNLRKRVKGDDHCFYSCLVAVTSKPTSEICLRLVDLETNGGVTRALGEGSRLSSDWRSLLATPAMAERQSLGGDE